ncbi:hypothetical protein [Echinicola rosea]|nr:hypothetical protein [Echinicola rosea]
MKKFLINRIVTHGVRNNLLYPTLLFIYIWVYTLKGHIQLKSKKVFEI